MNTIVRLLMLISLLVVVAVPSYAQSESGEAWHVYQCQILDETSEDQVIALVERWMESAKTMKGAEKLEVYVFFPVASMMGDTDFRILVKAPSFAEWGAIWDVYDDSAAADIEDEWAQMFDCPDSWLFEGFKIEGVEPEP
jgi:hypothetical protein